MLTCTATYAVRRKCRDQDAPRHRIVVNLALATVRKVGPAYDLPIALGVIVLGGHLPHEAFEQTLVVGKLSLDGNVRHARGVLPMAATARAQGLKRIVVPETDAGEAALIPELDLIPVRPLATPYQHLSGRQLIEPDQPRAMRSSRCSYRAISPRSRARSTSSARWKWLQRAGTT
jgi:predicted ATPase with chaperone activity